MPGPESDTSRAVARPVWPIALWPEAAVACPWCLEARTRSVCAALRWESEVHAASLTIASKNERLNSIFHGEWKLHVSVDNQCARFPNDTWGPHRSQEPNLLRATPGNGCERDSPGSARQQCRVIDIEIQTAVGVLPPMLPFPLRLLRAAMIPLGARPFDLRRPARQ
jgi:hypothetical protein